LPCFYSFTLIHMSSSYLYTLSLHDALPIFTVVGLTAALLAGCGSSDSGETTTKAAGEATTEAEAGGLTTEDITLTVWESTGGPEDRKSTRLNSSHVSISYAVFCLKKKN